MASAWPCAAWCFHSFGQACGSLLRPSTSHSGVPSARAGSTVQAVKSVAMPMTAAGSTPPAASAAGTARRSTSRQSSGLCSAQSGGSGPVPSGSRWSMTPWAYSTTALPTSRPSATRTTTARPDRVPKSTPTAYCSMLAVTPSC